MLDLNQLFMRRGGRVMKQASWKKKSSFVSILFKKILSKNSFKSIEISFNDSKDINPEIIICLLTIEWSALFRQTLTEYKNEH